MNGLPFKMKMNNMTEGEGGTLCEWIRISCLYFTCVHKSIIYIIHRFSRLLTKIFAMQDLNFVTSSAALMVINLLRYQYNGTGLLLLIFLAFYFVMMKVFI